MTKILLAVVDAIATLVPAASVVLATLTTDPVRFTNPKALEPVPVKVELNLERSSLIS